MPDTVTAITVILAAPTLGVGSTTTATARVTTTVPDTAVDQQTIVWTSSAPAVATVTATTTGVVVKAIAVGTATIRAAIGTVSGSAPFIVSAPVVPVAMIDAAAEAIIKAVPVGGALIVRGPTIDFTVSVTG